MSAPIIDNAPLDDVVLSAVPGTFADVEVVAHDPDSASGTGTITVSDASGNETPVEVNLRVDDALTFGEAVLPPELVGLVSVVQIAVQPNRATYRFTVL